MSRSETIVITNMEYTSVPYPHREFVKRVHVPDFTAANFLHWDLERIDNFKTAVVTGRRFVNPQTGADVVVGMDADSANLLGLQYEAFEAQAKTLEQHRSYYYSMQKASFKERLKWLFKGAPSLLNF